MRSGCRGFESRSGHSIFSGICSVYIDRHIRVDLSDDEQYMFEICLVTYNVYGLLYIWSDELSSRRSREVIPSPRGLEANAWQSMFLCS